MEAKAFSGRIPRPLEAQMHAKKLKEVINFDCLYIGALRTGIGIF